MSEKDEREMAESIKEIRDALMGDMSGKNPGVLHSLRKIYDDFYSMENPKRSHPERLLKLEQKESERRGAAIVWGLVGGGAMVIIEVVASILFGKK